MSVKAMELAKELEYEISRAAYDADLSDDEILYVYARLAALLSIQVSKWVEEQFHMIS